MFGRKREKEGEKEKATAEISSTQHEERRTNLSYKVLLEALKTFAKIYVKSIGLCGVNV